MIIRGRWALALGSVAVFAALFAASAFWRASRALKTSENEVAGAGQFSFVAAAVQRNIPPGVEYLNTPSSYKDLIRFRGDLYLCGPSGLSAYDVDGRLLHNYRVGLELPPGPLVQMAVGVASDSHEPELWIATGGEGLLAFNGVTFRQIRASDPAARKLTAVLPLSTGQILLGTEKNGVLVYDGRKLAQFHSELAGVHVTALAGSGADVWIGTLNRGVLHWNAGQVAQFGEAEGLPDNQILALATHADRLYAGTAVGTAVFHNGKLEQVLARGVFARSLLAREQSLFIGTIEEGIIEVSLQNHRTKPLAESIPGEITRLVDLDGSVFAVSPDGISSVSRGGSWKPVLQPASATLADRNISAISIDRGGRLWVGYFDRGLDVLEPGFTRASHIEDEHVFCINRIVQDDRKSSTAVATANGLALFDAAARVRQVLTRSDGLIANHITDVLIDGDGMVLATPAGLTFTGSGGMRSLYAFHGLVNNHTYALAASHGKLLVGTLGGASLLETGVVKASYTTTNSGLRHNWITAVVPSGDEWYAGTYGAGVLHMDASSAWQSYPDMPKNVIVNPNAMAASGARLFAGTLGQGLLVYQQGRWHTITNGLPSSNVTAVAAAGGYLYIGTDNGLVRMSESAL
jgi:ligand-binding sensor domain-containing protein